MYAQWKDGQASPKQWRTGAVYNTNDKDVYSKKPNEKGMNNYYYDNAYFAISGNEAEFAWLKVDIMNLQKTEANFMKDMIVKVVYDDEYEYNGWVRQFNYDYSKSEVFRYKETSLVGWPVCLSPVDEMSIAPMYKGHYVFGCTLPNAVVEDKEAPLRMIITIGGHTLTYNIR